METNPVSITISITIPKQLEYDLQQSANAIGISRSRFIGNLLLAWQSTNNKPLTPINDCVYLQATHCSYFDRPCTFSTQEAQLTCSEYK